MQFNVDNSLQNYFTDMEYQREIFRDFLSAEKLSKQIIVFYGVGGVGKSSLLGMLRFHCKATNFPVALASGDDAKSVLDIVVRWSEDLKEAGIKLPTFSKTLIRYRSIEAKVEDQVRKGQSKVAHLATKAVSKTAETAGGALLGATIGAVIPGLGTAVGGALGGVLGGMGVESLIEWLLGFLPKPDVDFLLDPTKKVSDDFFADIASYAAKRRIVLLLDTFEQMSTLEVWVCGVVQHLHPNVLIVIAGRKLPAWDEVWPGWLAKTQVEELRPMNEGVMRELVYRYHATIRGGEPNEAQVDAIIRFAQGLPMAVTGAVQLWVKYGLEDFQAVKAEIVANLVDRLMKGVPRALIPALEAAAVVRWFDQPILRALMKQDDVRDVYNELRRFTFVRARAEGLALHDSVREMIDENLRLQDSERYVQLHEYAEAYFEKRLEKATGEEIERAGLERLYHRIRANEEKGVQLFHAMAEKLAQYRLVIYLRKLINDVSTYTLRTQVAHSWLSYYRAQLAEFERHLSQAETNYANIIANPQVDSILKSYALSNLGNILTRGTQLSQSGGSDRALKVLEEAQQLLPPNDVKRVHVLNSLRRISIFHNDWQSADQYIEQIIEFCKRTGDTYHLLLSLGWKLGTLEDRGELKNSFAVEVEAMKQLDQVKLNSYLKWSLLDRSWHVLRSGRFKETEQRVHEAVQIAERNGLTIELVHSLSKLGYYSSYQNKFDLSLSSYRKCADLLSTIESGYQKPALQGYWGGTLVMMGNYEEAENLLIEGLRDRLQVDKKGAILPKAWIGTLYELKKDYQKARQEYEEALLPQWLARRYLACKVYTGLVRTEFAMGNYQSAMDWFVKADGLAREYEYNDHLASLRLTKGHMAWKMGNRAEAVTSYKQAMIYALRYNRFLLDEVVNGRIQGTPLYPLTSFYLQCGTEGKKMLSELRDWWATGLNDIGHQRLDTISPIPEGMPLLDAEKLARTREVGDGSEQTTVMDQLHIAINGSLPWTGT